MFHHPCRESRRGVTMALAALLLGATARPLLAQGDLNPGAELLRTAIEQVCTEAATAIQAADVVRAPDPIAVLPIRGDQGRRIHGQLKIAVSTAGLTCVEGRDDPILNEILQEIKWDELREDVLDPATVAKFGKLKAGRYLLYGVLREASANERRAYVELELHLTSILTKTHVWGRVLSRRYYAPGGIEEGIVEMDEASRETIREAVDSGLPKVTANPRLATAKVAVLLPLAGDVGGYLTGKVEEMLLRSGKVSIKRLGAQTLAEVDDLLRDQPGAADAVLYGAVRDLHREKTVDDASRIEYKIYAEIQIKMQAVKTGEVLLAETLGAVKTVSQNKPGLQEHLKDQLAADVRETVGEHPLRLIWIALGVVGALVALLVVYLMVRRLFMPR